GKARFGSQLRRLMPPQFAGSQKVWVPALGPHGETIHNSDGTPSLRRANGYHIPPLEVCRDHVTQMVHAPFSWATEAETSAAEPKSSDFVDQSATKEGNHDPFDLTR